MKRMLFNATHAEETRVGIVDGQKLIDIDIESAGREQRKSNIYKGIITRIEPSLEACFVDYGEERHGFLPFKEVSRSYFKEGVDVRTATIREALTEGQELIVQVEKEERGNKGAALTTFISLAGRYLVLMPNNPRGGGVSRRIEGEERQELRAAMEQLDLPAGMSTIARTAGIGRTVEELQWDLNYLLKLWSAISEAATPQYEWVTTEKGRTVTHYITESVKDGKPLKRANPAPFLIVEESNLVIRAIRDYFQPDIGEILVDTDEIYDQARQFMAHVMPDMVGRVKRYREETPLFSRFQIEHQIETAYSRTVPLPSGGAIVIDHTEALVAVDVNSARATRGSDIEETALKTNLEAAEEVARQMRLRDLGGLIVIDFIDMEDPKNQREIEQCLRDAIRPDRARVQIGRISRFGLMELSRQRLRPSLSEGHHITCPRCNGVGVIRDTESCALQVLRILQEEATKEGTGALHAQVPVDVATYLLNEKRAEVSKLEARYRVPVVLIPNTMLETPHYHIERLRTDDERLEDSVASYNRAEDLTTVADDPYALKSDEDKPARPRQVPVIKNILPTDVAPVHEKAPEAAKTEEKGFFASIVSAISSIFGGKSEEKKEEEKKPAEKKGRRDDRNRRGRTQERRQGRGERAERTDRRQDKDERSEKSDEARTNRGRRTRRPRREEPTDTAEQTPAVAPAAAASEAAPAAVTPETPAASAEAAAAEEKPARTLRPRRQSRKVQAAAEDTPVQAPEALPETPAAEPVADVDDINAAFTEARHADRHGPSPVLPADVMNALDAEVGLKPADAEDSETAATDAPEGDSEQMIESDSRRRRPRRRRRPTKTSEGVQVMSDAPATEAPAAAEARETVKTEMLNQVETQAPAAETKAEEVKTEAAEAAAPAAGEPAPAAHDISEGLEENLAKAGLTQVQTDASLAEPYSYTAVKYPGRPRPVVEAVVEEHLEQVHTDPKYMA